MRYLLLPSLLLFFSGCAAQSSGARPEAHPGQAAVAATPSPEPPTYQRQELSRRDVRILNMLLPAGARKVLERAEEIELFSIAPCGPGYMPSPERNEPGKFQGCPILKRAAVTDAGLRRNLLDALYDGVAKSTGGMACFYPRHGVRGSHKGKRVDLIICFECRIFSGLYGSERIGGSISDLPEPFFNRVLESAGAPAGGE